jgi:hypothetical protein
MHRAAMLLENAANVLRPAHPELKRITIGGDLRRGCELVADLALVAEAPALEDGPKALTSGGELTVHLTDKKRYGITLLLATGSAAHIEALRALAERKGFALGPDGLRRGRRIIAASSEESIYEALGLSFIEPELREAGVNSSGRLRAVFRALSLTGMCVASSMRIPTFRTVWTRLKSWCRRPGSAVMSILVLPTIRSQPTTPGASQSRKS